MTRFGSLLFAVMTVGVAVDAAFIFFPMSSSTALDWFVTGLLVWVAGFGFGIYRWGVRGLWLLLGLPLFFVPFIALVVASGSI
jgi:hypothetical protein